MTRLVRAASLTQFAELATDCGLDPLALVDAVGLPPACLRDPDLKIDADAVLRLLELAARQGHEPAFGLRLGETRLPSNVGPLAVATRDAPTLGHVLDLLVRHIGLHNEALVMQVEREGPLTTLRMELNTGKGGDYRQGTELALTAAFRLLSLFLGAGWRPRAVCFAHPAPASLAVHRRIFGPALSFGQAFNGIVCNTADLDAPNPSADPVMARYASQFLRTLEGRPRGFPDQVLELVLMLLPLGRCTADVVAQHLGCDRRTVHRRLARGGTSFQRLVDDHRASIVQRYVAAGDLTLAQIAAQLGFSSRTALSRWHRTRFGASPRSAR